MKMMNERTQLLGVVELHAPASESVEALEERFSHKATCNRCRGSRKIQTWNGEYQYTPCPVCKGRGEVVADILIKWRPST